MIVHLLDDGPECIQENNMKANYLAKELRQNPLWKMRVVTSKKAYSRKIKHAKTIAG
jgi:hypothetical protein